MYEILLIKHELKVERVKFKLAFFRRYYIFYFAKGKSCVKK